jgi:hypothetical protein
MRCTFLLLLAGAACAQQREFGALGGGGFLPSLPVQGAPTAVSAGLAAGPVAGALFGQDLYSHLGGELRYLYQQRNLSVTSGGTSAVFSGQAHVVHYDLLYYPRPRQQRVRAYVSAGGGMKLFRGTGSEAAYQPLMQYAYLTQTSELKPMLTVGGGVKIYLGRRMLLRVDVRDEMTQFPTKLITPAPGLSVGGWLHDVVPTVGFSWAF